MDMGMDVSCGDELRYDLMKLLDLIGELELGFVVELRNAELFIFMDNTGSSIVPFSFFSLMCNSGSRRDWKFFIEEILDPYLPMGFLLLFH